MATRNFNLPGRADDGAELELVHVVGSGHHRSGDFNLALVGYGFEASRYLTRDELADLRDWITRVLAA